MSDVSKKNILALTLKQLSDTSYDDILAMIKSNLDDNNFSEEYYISIAGAIARKIISLKDYAHRYDKFYRIITAVEFRKNDYILKALEEDIVNLYDLLVAYDKNSELIDTIMRKNEKIFDELINNDYNIKEIFDEENIGKFTNDSYQIILSYLLKDDDKKRVVKALFKNKNSKFLDVVAIMDDAILKHTEDDMNYFDTILTLFNYNDYRHLLWDYYRIYFAKDKKSDEISDELKELINYSFALMNTKYSIGRVPNIVNNMKEMLRNLRDGKEMVHVTVFGIDGYRKIKDNTFDIKKDFINLDNANLLLNLKIAFFGTIYGITYDEASKIIDNFNSYMKELKNNFNEKDRYIYETVIAMKSLYNLTLDEPEQIRLYQNVYYNYIKKNGIYASVKIEASSIMEELLRKMYDDSIEML